MDWWQVNVTVNHIDPFFVRSTNVLRAAFAMTICLLTAGQTAVAQTGDRKIVHDAEYYVLEAQNGERWGAEDQAIDARLAALREKYGHPPNIVHIMWDDTAYGDVGIPAIQKVRCGE